MVEEGAAKMSDHFMRKCHSSLDGRDILDWQLIVGILYLAFAQLFAIVFCGQTIRLKFARRARVLNQGIEQKMWERDNHWTMMGGYWGGGILAFFQFHFYFCVLVNYITSCTIAEANAHVCHIKIM